MIEWREPNEKICRPCCDMKNMCSVCQMSPLLSISVDDMPQSIMNEFVISNIKKLSKRRQALVFRAVSNRWRQSYCKKKISAEQALEEVEAILKYFLEKPEGNYLF